MRRRRLSADTTLDRTARRWLDGLQIELEAEIATTSGFRGPVRPDQRVASWSLDIVDHARQQLLEAA